MTDVASRRGCHSDAEVSLSRRSFADDASEQSSSSKLSEASADQCLLIKAGKCVCRLLGLGAQGEGVVGNRKEVCVSTICC